MKTHESKKRIIGIDFDNTIVSYDTVMHKVAMKLGWIDETVLKNKKIVRDTIRQLSDGELKWQKVQAIAYGKQMTEATLIDGVDAFFKFCHKVSMKVFIVSHKTEFAVMDVDQINLRDAALSWMKSNHFFDNVELGLSGDNVFFESSRQGKIERIKKLNCTHFIDDLEETFCDASFPTYVEKILYTQESSELILSNLWKVNTWKKINEYFASN